MLHHCGDLRRLYHASETGQAALHRGACSVRKDNGAYSITAMNFGNDQKSRSGDRPDRDSEAERSGRLRGRELIAARRHVAPIRHGVVHGLSPGRAVA